MRGKYRGEQDVGQDRGEGGEHAGAGGFENYHNCGGSPTGALGIEKYRYCGSPKVNMHELEMEETSITETTIDGEAMENIVPEVVG